MHFDKKRWVSCQPLPERGIFDRAWHREKLQSVRDLVRSALDLIAADSRASEAAAWLRMAIAEIDAELDKIE